MRRSRIVGVLSLVAVFGVFGVAESGEVGERILESARDLRCEGGLTGACGTAFVGLSLTLLPAEVVDPDAQATGPTWADVVLFDFPFDRVRLFALTGDLGDLYGEHEVNSWLAADRAKAIELRRAAAEQVYGDRTDEFVRDALPLLHYRLLRTEVLEAGIPMSLKVLPAVEPVLTALLVLAWGGNSRFSAETRAAGDREDEGPAAFVRNHRRVG